MDIATIGGIIGGIALVLFGIIAGGVGVGPYMDSGSALIVVGGTFSAFFVAYPLSRALSIGRVLSKIMGNSSNPVGEVIKIIMDLANVARKEGLLALEEAVTDVNDPFMKKGVTLIVDGTDPELVKTILETELEHEAVRHNQGKGMFDTLGSIAPAFGMIGTLIGLIAMLKNLDDPSTIGPSMAVALITTFYGSLMANLLFIPMAKKLEIKSADEALIKEVMIEGLLSIQAGENPRIIEEKLRVFLSPKVRKEVGTEEEVREEGEADG